MKRTKQLNIKLEYLKDEQKAPNSYDLNIIKEDDVIKFGVDFTSFLGGIVTIESNYLTTDEMKEIVSFLQECINERMKKDGETS